MPHIYLGVQKLRWTDKVGNGDCVDLVRHYTQSLKNHATPKWKPGALVMATTDLKPGTVIASFLCGKYPQGGTGQHAAFFLRYSGVRGADGKYSEIIVMDQWKGSTKPKISSRPIRRKGNVTQNCIGGMYNVSNTLEALYVVE